MKRLLVTIVGGICVAAAALCAYAGPNQAELQSYRVLVPDWSKTSGGTSPALSPDGKTLVYLAHGKVWVLSDLDRYILPSEYSSTPPVLPEAWQLQVKAPLRPETASTAVESPGPEGSDLEGFAGDLRNADWSPDGKQLAFVYEDGLFIAEDFDFKAKTAKTRMVASWVMYEEEVFPVESPRWSPDGDKIAFVRHIPASPTCFVGVLDVKSGERKVVARDATPGRIAWEQPWSPDGKSLVYASMEVSNDGLTATIGGISIVQADGKKQCKVIDENMTFFPSWSPKGDQLAYVAPYESAGLSSALPGLFVVDIEGKNPTPIAKHAPPKDQIDAAMEEMRNLLQQALKEQYPGVYSDAQLKRFAADDVTDNEAVCILMVAEAASQAKAIGGEFQHRMEQAMKSYAAAEEPDDVMGGFPPCGEASKAIDSLPEHQREPIQGRLTSVLSDVFRPLLWLKAKIDACPVWSPDGKSLAFVRWDLTGGNMHLVVVDMATGKTRTLLDANAVQNPIWTRDGKAIVVQANRNLAYKHSNLKTGFPWPKFITMPSYPEIWQLDLN